MRVGAVAIGVAQTVGAQTSALHVTHRARSVQPGEVVVLEISAPAALNRVQVSGFGRQTDAVRITGTPGSVAMWQAVIGIDVERAPGIDSVRVIATTAAGATLTQPYPLRVAPKTFRQRRLRVAPQFVTPPDAVQARIDRDGVRLDAIYSSRTDSLTVTLPFRRAVRQRMNSPFGAQSVFNGQVRGRHMGADFAAPAGTPVRAPAPGRVVLADELYYTGNTVIIDHGQGVYSILAHLRRISVPPGATVTTGIVVGEVGSTGRSSGPHLHWSLRVGEARVDPMSLVDLPPVSGTDTPGKPAR